ncbi:hypothetical protein PISMIDRAFT_94142, partial [Pisolithus microcarpus 441]
TLSWPNTNHTPLNQHLHQIKRSDTPFCLQCSKITPENVHHFLFQCPRYDREQHTLFTTLGRVAMSINYLLTNSNMQAHLLKYIDATKRLKDTFSDISLPVPQHR